VAGLSKLSVAVLAICSLVSGVPREASAQNHITVDGRFSTGPVPYSNGVYTIGANLGKQVGSSLFQSFG
jgi:hypothetical protein